MEKEFRPRRSDSKSTGRSYGHRKFSAGEGSGRPQRRSFHHDRDDKGENSDEKPRRSFRGQRDGGDRPRRSFGDKPRSFGDRPFRRKFNEDKEGGEHRERRSYGDKPRTFGDRPRRSFGDKPRSFGERPFRRKFNDDKEGGEHRERRSYGDKPRTSGDRPRRSFGDKPRSFGDRPFRRKFDDDKEGGEHRERRSYGDKPRTFGDRPRRSFGDKPRSSGERPFRRKFGEDKEGGEHRERRSFGDRDRKPRRDFNEERAARREEMTESRIDRFKDSGDEILEKQRPYVQEYTPKPRQPKAAGEEGTRLNKFIANSGICSRREADDYISAGVVSVNDQVVTEMGVKVFQNDVVKFNGEIVKGEKKVYIIMNKPKDYVTTTSDPHAEKTVMDLIEGKCAERVYPVGRLDRETTGVLLLTNDGELTEQLTHPSYEKKKIYQVFLDKNLKKDDFEKIVNGIDLEDGPIQSDALSYIDEDESQVGIEIHTGRNRIVRRIFESLGYEVKKLDRVYFAGLTKKGLRRGQWRFLTEQEIGMLKMGSYK